MRRAADTNLAEALAARVKWNWPASIVKTWEKIASAQLQTKDSNAFWIISNITRATLTRRRDEKRHGLERKSSKE